MNQTQQMRDRTQRFLFEEADIRGEIVQLDQSYREILAIHQYAPGVSHLLGEFLAASVLLMGAWLAFLAWTAWSQG